MTARVIKEGAAVLITQERYAEIAHLPLHYVKKLCSVTCEKWRCAKKFDERDLKRFSKNKVMIWYQPANPVSGQDRPRLREREEIPISLDPNSLAKTSRNKRGAVLDAIETASQEGRLFSTDEFEGED